MTNEAGDGHPHKPRSTGFRNLFVVSYLTVQVLLPINGFRTNRLETHGRFSWNMYSSVGARTPIYLAVSADGTARKLDLTRTLWARWPFRSSGNINAMVLSREILPLLHAYLCTHEVRNGEKLRGFVRASLNSGPTVDLVDHREVDLCAAPNHGVRPAVDVGN